MLFLLFSLQVWNHPVKVSHENVRRAADTNVWPVPYQPLSVQARIGAINVN